MSAKATRLQKIISQAGIASRRRAEEMILAGQVRVNGQVVHRLGTSVVAGQDSLEVNGKPLRWDTPPQREVWAFYKPKRCVTTLHDPEGRTTVKEFFPSTPARLIPVGRLDYDAEGLLLLTNDGDLANRIAHPSGEVSKVYLVKIKGELTPEILTQLRRGSVLQGRKRKPVSVRPLHTLGGKTWVEVTLIEGVHHHLKKMFAQAGCRVLKIKRYQVGSVALQDLSPGEARKLGAEEIARLTRKPRNRGKTPPGTAVGASRPSKQSGKKTQAG